MDELVVDLQSSFDSQIVICEDLFACLEQEQDFLRKNAFEAMATLNQTKISLAESLEKKTKSHQELIAKFLNKEFSDATHEALFKATNLNPTDKSILQSKHQKVKDLLAKCQRKNEVNGKVIHVNRQFNEQLVNILKGVNSTAVYTQKGTIDKSGSTHASTKV